MPLNFPNSPTDGQIYDNYYWDNSNGVWNSLGNYAIPNLLSNATFTSSGSSIVPVTVRGASSQAASLQEWKNNSGTNLATISASGGLTLNNALTVPNGGTGATSLTSGAYLKGAGASAITAQTGIPAGDIDSGTLAYARLSVGSVIQHRSYSFNTNVNGTSGGYVDIHSGTRLAITATRANSRFIIMANVNWLNEGTRRQFFRCIRDGSTQVDNEYIWSTSIGSGWTSMNIPFLFDDTSAKNAGQTYTYSFQTAVSAGTFYYNYNFSGVTGRSTYNIFEVVA